MSTKTYHGSCHCGNVQYQVKLTLPPIQEIGSEGTKLYRCNCGVCHKLGMFHCRPANLNEDFIITSPAKIEDVGEYLTLTKKVGWYFCKSCGVRTFGMGGEWATEEIDVAKWAGEEGGDGKVQKVIKSVPVSDGTISWDGKPLHYVSVNAVTLDGLDLIEAHDKGWVYYVNNRGKPEEITFGMRFKEPYPGGCY